MRANVVSKTAIGLGVMLVVTAVALPGPVVAKGVEAASIDGPGLAEPIEIGSGPSGALEQLADLAAMWAVTPGNPEPVTLLERAPATRLGPSYTLTWSVLAEEATTLVQELYPHADGGPLVYTTAGQMIFDGPTGGGWYQAPDALHEELVSLGIPSLEELAGTGGSGHCENGE